MSVKAITKLSLGHLDKSEIFFFKKIAVGYRPPDSTRTCGHFTLLFCRGRQKKCTKNYNARAQLLFCSLNLLVALPLSFAVVVILSSLIIFKVFSGIILWTLSYCLSGGNLFGMWVWPGPSHVPNNSLIGLEVRFHADWHWIPLPSTRSITAATRKKSKSLKGPVIRATFFFSLSRNIVALQVETQCCSYYHVCDQHVSQQNTVLQVSGILHVLVSRL